jgi:hypothetical protein
MIVEGTAMAYETNRVKALRNGLLFRTDEMVEWLGNIAALPEGLSEALVGAWVGALRSEVLHRAEQSKDFLKTIESGEGKLPLDQQLAPESSSKKGMWAQICRETGLPYAGAGSLLQTMGKKLQELEGTKAFEPIGWVTCVDSDRFVVTLWRDFLQPCSYESAEQRDE